MKKFVVAAVVMLVSVVFPLTSFAAVSSGGNYTLQGSPTAISSPVSSGGDYSVAGTGNSIGGASSGGNYSANGNQPTNGSGATSGGGTGGGTGGTSGGTTGTTGTASGTSGGVSGQSSGQQVLVSNVVVSRPSPTSVKVTFTTSSAIESSISYESGSSTAVTVTDAVPITQHSFILGNLSPATHYDFVIGASAAEPARSSYSFGVTLGSLTTGSGSTAPVVTHHTVETGSAAATPTPTPSTISSTTSSSSPLERALSPDWLKIAIILGILVAIIGIVAWDRSRSKNGPFF